MVSQLQETKWTHNYEKPRMVSTPWENKGTKKKFRLNLGSCPNDEKPMEETLKHRENQGLRPNDGKPKEQRINWDGT